MKKIFIPIIAVLALFSAVSCEPNLDIPQKGVIGIDDFYASNADAEAALASMYANYLGNVASTEGIDNPEQVMLNYSADDILAAGGHANDHEPFRWFCEFRYDASNATLKQAYQRYYYAIYHANLVISNFTNENRDGVEPEFTSDYTNQCVAEARVMRAYLHMMLALSWYNPPIVDRVYGSDEPISNAKDQKEVLDWVIAECDKALKSGHLPERNGTTDKDATARMSVGFAQFVAGKAAMFNNDPATARQYLGALIESGNYALIPSDEYWTNFHIAGDGNSEKIFEPNFIEDPAFTNNAWGLGQPIFRGRWMVANVLNWRMDALASSPNTQNGVDGWNGGAITEAFAEKFLAHDGDSPRRKACFITEEEFLYEMDWSDSKVNNGTLEEKKADPARGIKSAGGLYSHSKYFEWKHMVYINPPAILTGGKTYPSDNVSGLGPASNQKNFNVARYAEALLLYAEACIGSADAAKGLAALNAVQVRSGSGKVSSELTLENVMEEKQYEMWFESCRFHDLVRWSKQGKVDLPTLFNGDLHKKVPTVFDEYFIEGKPNYQKEHKFYVEYGQAIHEDFKVGKHEYFPFPLDFTRMNPNLQNIFGWAN